MQTLNTLGLLLGSSWASGVNLYLTIAVLGIAQRMHWVTLPGDMSVLSHPLIIATALLLYAVEFIADKIPYVDSMWDSFHTFIRPVGGAVLGYMAMSGASPAIQIPVALITGSIALDSHLTKAVSRAAINTSPEPFSNTAASVTEDASVGGVLFLIMAHPIVAGILVVLFIIFSILFLKKMFYFLKRIFNPPKKNEGNQLASGS